MSSGLRPIAVPTARTPTAEVPTCSAIWPYVAVAPYGISSSACHTRRWNSVPPPTYSISKRVSRPSKYDVNCPPTSSKAAGAHRHPSWTAAAPF
jgi:hypothetical protein